MGSDKESLSAARRLLQQVLGTTFEYIRESNRPAADLRSVDGNHIAEVKRITPKPFLAFKDAMNKQETTRKVPELKRHWYVLIRTYANSIHYPPIPEFTEPTVADKDLYAQDGLLVHSKQDQENEYLRTLAKQTNQHPKIKGMIDTLIPHLIVLEQYGESKLSKKCAPSTSEELCNARTEIIRMTSDATVISTDVDTKAGGISLVSAQGEVRTGRPDIISSRIQTWLSQSKDQVSNICESLQETSPNTHRHAILVFSGETEPEFFAVAQSDDAIPTGGLNIPDEIDTLWALFDCRALSYNRKDGWYSHSLAP
ncbi:hypothetical protein NQ038_08180 [Brevibacterium sp. 50QC2O2]|uniref:hypothetical protein n=1 Tax=Brevibacterium sp. 50QC2O2 TaxID=2968459 RepID=UPI00211BC62D|nr:hypothetical protein [Brevibacterium sp. 50QC2O2]MCQ9388623.1 hypothetical protein [Brevibacterium sp. 50QC2O2]